MVADESAAPDTQVSVAPPDDTPPPDMQPEMNSIIQPPPPDLPPPVFPVQAPPPPPPQPKPKPPTPAPKPAPVHPSPKPAQPAQEASAPAASQSQPGPATAAAAPKTVGVSQVAFLVRPAPVYPRRSVRDNEQGTVMIRVLIDPAGRPGQVSLQTSSGFPALDESAISAVRAAQFRPYSEGGVPQAVWVLVPVTFSLK
ncbi:energy transducer TonB [Enhydrobacter aerosaccus]|nr:energy transducer TonB [Enhydrobacter aerosaccus]